MRFVRASKTRRLTNVDFACPRQVFSTTALRDPHAFYDTLARAGESMEGIASVTTGNHL